MTTTRFDPELDEALDLEEYGDDPTLEPTPEVDPAIVELLKRHGFDHVPAEEELREYKARRQAEVREEVLFQADRRNWCDDGTRKVCANLRIPRPGQRETHEITFQVTMDVTLTLNAYSAKGALARAYNGHLFPVEGRQWYPSATRTSNVTMGPLMVGGQPIELTEDLRRELTDGNNE